MTDKELDEYLSHHFILKPEPLRRSNEIKEAAILLAQVVLDNTRPGVDQTVILHGIKLAVSASGLALAAEELP